MATKSAQQAQQEDEQNERLSDLEQQAPPAPDQQAPGSAAPPSMIDQLNELATLHQQGALTDAEFTTAKAKLLGT
jgi:hypothetical protein